MMISPEYYISEHTNDTFEQLIEERDQSVNEIHRLEKMLFSDESTSEELLCHPSPDVRYQMKLQYLAALCTFICNKYNQEIVWGEDMDDDIQDI